MEGQPSLTLGLQAFLHFKYPHIVVDSYHPSSLETVEFMLMMTHDYRGSLFTEEVDETTQGKFENIVGSQHHDDIIYGMMLYSKEKIADGA